MSLSAARDEVRRLKAAHRDGNLGRATAPPEVETVAELAALFTENLKLRRKHPKQAISVIEKRIVPALGGLKITDVRWADVIRVIEATVKDAGPVAGKKVFDLTKQMLGYAVGRDLLAGEPLREPRPRGLRDEPRRVPGSRALRARRSDSPGRSSPRRARRRARRSGGSRCACCC